MNQVSRWRLGFIIAITALCILLVLPTARYLWALSADAPEEQLDAIQQGRIGPIQLGLDLQGGVDLTLMIDEQQSVRQATAAMVQRINNQFEDENISAEAQTLESGYQFRVQIFEEAAARSVFNILQSYSDQIAGDISQQRLEQDQALVLEIDQRLIGQAVESDIQGAEKVIRERLDRFGLTQPSIAIQGRDQIRIQIPGRVDPRLIDNITSLAHLEFRLVHEDYGTEQDPLNQIIDPATGEPRPDAVIPLGHELMPFQFGGMNQETGEIEYTTGYMLVEKEAQMTGENLRSAGVIRDQFDLDNPIKVSIQFDNEGADRFAEISRESVDKLRTENQPLFLAMILDGVVRSAPAMRSVITGGSAVIEGGFTQEEAQDLSLLLKAGALRAPLIVESQQQVGATLGTQSIFSGVQALALGTVLIVILMILYYGEAGVISILALILNVLIILAVLALADATLTLSGIGGILLTIGMAVDANVLIYERIREEIDSGRPLRQSIVLGFDRALGVIWDSNLTTLMTAVVLLQFTEGAVFGFALTMMIGLVANLFTGLFVTRTLAYLWFQKRGKLSIGKLRIFANPKYNWIGFRWISWGFSAVTLAVCLIWVLAQGGLTFGVDFAGGLLTEVRFEEDTNETAIRSMLRESGLEGERVQRVTGGEANDFIIRVKMLETATETGTRVSLPATETALETALNQAYGAEGYEMLRTTSFGAETGQGFRNMAITVVVLAAIAIMLYLWVRFEFIFGAAAVVALVHDLALTVLISSIWGVEISLIAVAALMVMLGFSVNDTIVIFDRIREIVRKSTGENFAQICNAAINQSLSRTVITSGTAVVVIVVMLLIGGEGLRDFAKVLLVGALVGTYSSGFTATPIVYQWNEYRRGQAVEKLREKTAGTGPEEPEAPRRARGGGTLPKRRAV